MPHTCRSQYSSGSAQLGGKLPLPIRHPHRRERRSSTIVGVTS
jgi:hypothetical protein